MRNTVATFLAGVCRNAPFECGRWRIGSLASRLFESGPMPRGRRTVSTRHGFDMHLTMSELVDREIYCQGVWEPLATQLFAQVLRPGDAVADVGANIGWFSLLAARLTGPRGRVHAFEASRPTFALLGDNLSLNAAANVEPHLVAVGESAGRASIIQREAGNRGADCAGPDLGGPGSVPMVRLDEVLAGVPLRLIKLDIEGWEAKALRGASGLLDKPAGPDLLFEFTPDFLRAAGDDPAELLRWLAALDYRMSMITPAGLEPLDAEVLERRQTYLYCRKNQFKPLLRQAA